MNIHDYQTPANKKTFLGRAFPSLRFYPALLKIVFRAAALAKRGEYSDREWVQDNHRVLSILEKVGCRFEVDGRENLTDTSTPQVFVANHMSTLETFVLPGLVHPERPMTFVIKKQLVDFPVFKHIMLSRRPVVVSRHNPREDFKTVMREGLARLREGISVVVFPQTTRSSKFDPQQFNSLGIKLAKKAEVPVVPVALKTDAWSNGRVLKDFGPIRPERPIRFVFAPPMPITGGGKKEQEKCLEFITQHMKKWGTLAEGIR